MENHKYLDRDISWLSFNSRVSDESYKPIPLAERVLFQGITFSNLDEFLMVRYPAALVDCSTNEEWFKMFRKEVEKHHSELSRRFMTFNEEHGIVSSVNSILNTKNYKWLESYFKKNVFPALIPITIGSGRHLEPHFGVYVYIETSDKNEVFRNFIHIPNTLPRMIRIPESTTCVLIEDLVMHNLEFIFKDRKIVNSCSFAVLRSAEVYFRDSDNYDQYELIEKTLHERRKAWITRLEISAKDKALVNSLKAVLPLVPNTLIFQANIVNLADLKSIDQGIYDEAEKIRELKVSNPFTTDQSVFNYIRQGDRLVFHPYESYQDTFVRFLEESATDEGVVSIKITLYRVAHKSRIIDALLKAADSGKQVTVLVELKARFDEHHNVKIASILREGGVNLVYGSTDLKTHAKVCIVTRLEKKGLRVYSHIGTGNYNESNAKLYTDYSYFTADQDIGTDLTRFFNLLTSSQGEFKSRKIVYAPYNLRSTISDNIDQEIKKAKSGKRARIIFKCNSLTDDKIADKLIEAASSGVKVTLIIRGSCIIEPRKNIRIYSIIGRLLEHSRCYVFGADNETASIYIGSADVMYRNLNERNELLMMVEHPDIRKRIIWHIKMYINDTVNRRIIKPNYQYEDAVAHDKKDVLDCQEEAVREARKRMG